jgi:hypothetical protein
VKWTRSLKHRVVAIAAVLAAAALWSTGQPAIGSAQSVQVPIFEYDPTFPKPLRETWAIGPIGGLAVDRQDHLYVVQRPGGLLTNERFAGAGDTPPKAGPPVPAISLQRPGHAEARNHPTDTLVH